jgi:hypothetical protein
MLTGQAQTVRGAVMALGLGQDEIEILRRDFKAALAHVPPPQSRQPPRSRTVKIEGCNKAAMALREAIASV